MEKQLIRDFEKSFENSNLDSQKINVKKEFLNKFIKEGLPGKNLENWKNFSEEYIDVSSVSNSGLDVLKDQLVSFLSSS